ncbi:MAG: FCD domain-containing protein [Candidatus Adiutrix sp.]|jgi:GntR family transcriptional repressor for pyruvate dehydrogenase complex|nr:FCD domain-containing protein [Candidatus Adiutrix sp.]
MAVIKKISAVDEVFQLLQRRIADGDLPLGHRFPPQEVMAEQLGVSRSTIREAINKLTLLGFLAAKPGVGTTVVGNGSTALSSALSSHIFLSSGTAPQLIEARLYLEKAAVRLAVLKADEGDIAGLENILARQAASCRQGDLTLFSELDASFHRRIVESSKNPMLLQFLALIADGLSRFIMEVNLLQSAAENALHFHRLIFKHLAARDPVRTENVLVEHLQDVSHNIERNLGQDLGLKAMFRQEIECGPRPGPAPKR